MDVARSVGRSYATMGRDDWATLAAVVIACGWRKAKIDGVPVLAAGRPASRPAIPRKGETGDADEHHRPCRGFRNRRSDDEGEVQVRPAPPSPFVGAGCHAEGAEGLSAVG